MFVNYRTLDVPFVAASAYEYLAGRFGAGRVFLDQVSMGPGEVYPRSIWTALEQARVLVVLVGPKWLAIESGTRVRLVDREDDWVRREIRCALEREIAVIPVLVDGTSLASPDTLPHDVRVLAMRQAVEIRHRSLGADLARLGDAVARWVSEPSAGVAGSTPVPAGRGTFPRHPVLAEPSDRNQDGHRSLAAGPESGGVAARLDKPHPADSPRQLPPAVTHFVGRSRELSALSDYLNVMGQHKRIVVVTSIDGTAGVGKTTLALLWAHQVSDRFPDGQLYLNLRGFSSCDNPMTTVHAINMLLDAFQAPSSARPVDVDALIALYRSVVADKRLLIVLDNARDPDQVRQLLPGSSSCFVLVTSRLQLASLVAKDHAGRIGLNLLVRAEAYELLECLLGKDRVLTDSLAVEELIECCARLPLALSIVAARALMNPGMPLGALTAELRERNLRMAALSTADSPETDLRTVFSWSYRGLSPNGGRLFRLLGVHPGPDISLAAVGPLAGQPESEVRVLPAELTRANLLEQHVPGRYQFHDLLRTFAAEQASTLDTDDDRRAAMRRSLEYYVKSACAATLALDRYRDMIIFYNRDPQIRQEQFSDHRQALAWCDREQYVLSASVAQAFDHGFDSEAWQIPWALAEYYLRRGNCHDWLVIQQVAVDAATRLSDPYAQAHSYRELGRVYKRLRRSEDATESLLTALELHCLTGNSAGQACAYRGLSEICEVQGRYADSISYAEQALAIYRAIGHEDGESRSYNYIGWCLTLLGQHEEALHYCLKALPIARKLDNRQDEAAILHSIAYAYFHLGLTAKAIQLYQQALVIDYDLDHRYHQSECLTDLGDAQAADNDIDGAWRSYKEALAILDELNHQDAAKVRSRLAQLDQLPRLVHNQPLPRSFGD